jgi:hypothetical protein
LKIFEGLSKSRSRPFVASIQGGRGSTMVPNPKVDLLA